VRSATTPGRLRDEVRVDFAGDGVRVACALWEVRLPALWVASHPRVEAFLRRGLTRSEVAADADPEAAGVLALLDAQGCIVPAPLTAPVSLRELRARFDRLRAGWYATYYAHPLWNRLRSGDATRDELVAYLVHNYHVSRAAGPVAARMAMHGPSAWRPFFSSDVCGEYWHCDAYYFVPSTVLGCEARDIRTYPQLPASTAFEQHALQMAEHDAIGHLLLAYFQESTVAFQADADRFYAEVERAYGMEGFFRSWQEHVGIDVAEDHAGGLARLFTGDVVVEPAAAARSIAVAWAAFHFLHAALDDASSTGQRGGVQAVASSDALADLPFVLSAVARTSLAALASSRGHDEIILAGRIAEGLASQRGGAEPLPLPRSPWALAVANALAESACRPAEWAAAVAYVVHRLALEGDAFSPLARLHEQAAETKQLAEIVDRWLTSPIRFPDDLCPLG
jgi:hypothetical protein